MQTYTLTEPCNLQNTIFNQASFEPVLLTDKSQSDLVMMSADTYRCLIYLLMELEDMLLAETAKSALIQSQMIGAETFAETLKQLAENGEN